VDDSKRLEMEGKWDQARGRVKEAWGVLTDDELDRTTTGFECGPCAAGWQVPHYAESVG